MKNSLRSLLPYTSYGGTFATSRMTILLWICVGPESSASVMLSVLLSVEVSKESSEIYFFLSFVSFCFSLSLFLFLFLFLFAFSSSLFLRRSLCTFSFLILSFCFSSLWFTFSSPSDSDDDTFRWSILGLFGFFGSTPWIGVLVVPPVCGVGITALNISSILIWNIRSI